MMEQIGQSATLNHPRHHVSRRFKQPVDVSALGLWDSSRQGREKDPAPDIRSFEIRILTANVVTE